MKKLFKTIFTFALFVAMYANWGMTKVFAQPDISATITYQTFYDDLSPYGNWIEYPGYDHVWSPRVDGDFRPYLTNGNWEYTTDGWAWASNYDWGWAPFHYGRWLYDPQYGWLWVPGYEWSPAWVTWGEVDDFYAWAPLFPGVNVGYAYNDWRPNSIYWNIVPRNHIYDRDVYRYAEDRSRDNSFVNRIHRLNNFNKTSLHNNFYARGPEIKNVEKFTDRKIAPVSIKSVDRIMPAKREGNSLQVYRPTVIHPQPESFKRMTRVNAQKVNAGESNVLSTERSTPKERVDMRQTETRGQAPQIQNREETRNREQTRMPTMDRAAQRQNIERMPEMRSPTGSFERRMPSSSNTRRR